MSYLLSSDFHAYVITRRVLVIHHPQFPQVKTYCDVMTGDGLQEYGFGIENNFNVIYFSIFLQQEYW